MLATMNQMAALIGRTTDEPEVVAFFMTQPATARRRKEGRTDLNGLRSLDSQADVPTDSRTVALQKLGPPTKSGADGSWDRFDSAAYCLHVSYAEFGDGIRTLTMMAPDTAP